ncbi:hypothetical protein GONAM_56_00090 [Gordonia namibiensis NBRC 108229]|uniref:Uncharacterized protein n=1 Tax=Gordonia namibiensis NBRC 108229 TaxID=1208314 RepID=K6X8Y1_9ACTN|nr:hypothetical protein GONAM_56_00090 [Gordonia namibiensis NBRC 108229]
MSHEPFVARRYRSSHLREQKARRYRSSHLREQKGRRYRSSHLRERGGVAIATPSGQLTRIVSPNGTFRDI